jgi:RNA polymerase sigma factor (sigma-70 family)
MTLEQQKLVEDNHNMIYSFLNKYNLSHNDWYDLAAIGLCKAAMAFKEDVSKFSTFAYKCMFNSVFHEKRRETQMGTIPEHKLSYYEEGIEGEDGEDMTLFDTLASSDNTENDSIVNIQIHKLMNNATDKDKKLISLIMDGYTQKEIGNIIGCSQTHVGRMTRRLSKLIV